MDSKAICNPKKLSLTDSLTDSLNNIGLRDASASKKRTDTYTQEDLETAELLKSSETLLQDV